MKKYLFVILLLLTTTAVHAQNYGFDIIFRGGVSIPETPSSYAQMWGKGPQLETGIEFTLSQPFSLGILAEYTRNDIATDQLGAGSLPAGARWSGGVMDIFSVAGFVNYRLAGRVGGTFPYLIIDAGVTRMKSSQQTFTAEGISTSVPSAAETAFRSAAGLGIDIPLSANVCFTLAGKYSYVFAKSGGMGLVPIVAGFKMVF
jgi:opacity protein-like surface antigen